MSAQNLTATATNASGGNGSINLNVRGGFAPYTYAWTGSNGFQAATEDLNGIPVGRYCVTVTDGLCGTAGLCVDVVGCPTINFSISDVPACSGQANGSLTVVGAPSNVAFKWSNGSINSSITELSAGIYTVTVTDPSGCQGVQSANVSSIAFAVEQGRGVQNACSSGSPKGSITLYVYRLPKKTRNPYSTDGYTFQWSNGATTPNITDLSEGNYTVTVTNLLNPSCSVVSTFTVGNNFNSVTVIQGEKRNLESCRGSGVCNGKIDLIAQSSVPINFAWSGPNGFSSTAQNISSLCIGTYVATVSDNNGCQKVLPPVTLCCCDDGSEKSPFACKAKNGAPIENLSINVEPKSPATASSNDGTISTTITGGTGDYIISWTGPNITGSTNLNFSNLGIGTYCITVKDGCFTQTQCVELVACDQQNIVITASAKPTCVSSSIGSATASATVNGATINKFKWSNGSNGTTLSNLPAGQYCVTATSVNGCSNSKCVTVSATALVERLNTTDCSWVDQVCPIDNAVINFKIRNVGSKIVKDGNTCTLRRLCNDGTSQLIIGGAGIYREEQRLLVDEFGRRSCSVVQGCIWPGSTTFIPNRIVRAGQTTERATGRSCVYTNRWGEQATGSEIAIFCFDEPTRRDIQVGTRCQPIAFRGGDDTIQQITFLPNVLKQKVTLAVSDQVKNELKLTTDSLETTLLYFDQNKLSNTQSTTAEPVIIGKPTPNPFREAFNIDITSMDDTKVAIQVTNSIGQVVYQKQQDLMMGKNQVIVELTGQPDGFYFVTITDAQNRKETRKIVKSKN